MNKIFKSFVILAVVAIAFGSASAVFAQAATPQGTGPVSGFANGRGGRRGGMLTANNGSLQDGILHDAMIAGYADALGVSVDELNTRLADGETMSAIALAEGFSFEDFRAIMVDVRTQVLDQAAADGTLTQEQADWLKTRGAGMGQLNGGRGNGQGSFGTGECPYGNTAP